MREGEGDGVSVIERVSDVDAVGRCEPEAVET